VHLDLGVEAADLTVPAAQLARDLWAVLRVLE
jgi:hypothetical protein